VSGCLGGDRKGPTPKRRAPANLKNRLEKKPPREVNFSMSVRIRDIDD